MSTYFIQDEQEIMPSFTRDFTTDAEAVDYCRNNAEAFQLTFLAFPYDVWTEARGERVAYCAPFTADQKYA